MPSIASHELTTRSLSETVGREISDRLVSRACDEGRVVDLPEALLQRFPIDKVSMCQDLIGYM